MYLEAELHYAVRSLMKSLRVPIPGYRDVPKVARDHMVLTTEMKTKHRRIVRTIRGYVTNPDEHTKDDYNELLIEGIELLREYVDLHDPFTANEDLPLYDE